MFVIFAILRFVAAANGEFGMRARGSILQHASRTRARNGAAFVGSFPKPSHRLLLTTSVYSSRECPPRSSHSRFTESSTCMHMMTTSASSTVPASSAFESLSNEEKSRYHELFLISKRIRALDSAYYGRDADEHRDLEISDEEYDALARKEAEICTAYPHLLTLLESETELGTKATRYGGRVGQLYVEEDVRNSKLPKKVARSPAKKRIKRQHLPNAPMQSLDNAMDEAEAVAWLNRVRKLLISTRQSGLEEPSHELIELSTNIFAEPKIDGLSLSLRYELQQQLDDRCIYEFVWAATRGDGSQGEDVTDVVKAAWMRGNNISDIEQFTVPDVITISTSSLDKPPPTIEVRGEVVLPQQSFEEFTKETAQNPNATFFSNARNAASGILLRSKEPASDEDLQRTRWLQSRLRFYAYDISVDNTGALHSLDHITGSNMAEMRTFLTDYGFEIPTPIITETLTLSSAHEVNSSDIPNLLEYHRNIMTARDESTQEASTTKNPSYQVDGVVYKLSDFNDRRICGSSSRTPRWAIAHKFPPLSAVTRLIDIDIQVGRTGALTPVALLEPIDLGGVIVSKASLHNFHFAKKLLMPTDEANSDSKDIKVRSGISVLVSRAGDVIPQVMKRVFDDAEEEDIDTLRDVHDIKLIDLEPPTKCPACGSPTSFEFISSRPKHRTKTKTKKEMAPDSNDEALLIEDETGQVLRCSGPQLLCQPRAVNALAYAYSRAGLDVKGISKAKLQQLTEEGIIRYPADLFAAFGNAKQESDTAREGKLRFFKSHTSLLMQLVLSQRNSIEMLQQISELPGWGTLSSENLAESIQTVSSRGVSLSRFIYSLGIPFIGTQASQLIAASYKTADAFLSALEDASSYDESIISDNRIHPFIILTGDDESEKVKGIGPVALSSLLAYSKEDVLVKAAKDLTKALTIHEETTVQAGVTSDNSPFKDMTIVFTGTLPISRTAAQNAVKTRGAKSTPNTVSKSTNLVVVGEKGGKKAKQAEELGVPIMEVDEFMKLIS